MREGGDEREGHAGLRVSSVRTSSERLLSCDNCPAGWTVNTRQSSDVWTAPTGRGGAGGRGSKGCGRGEKVVGVGVGMGEDRWGAEGGGGGLDPTCSIAE